MNEDEPIPDGIDACLEEALMLLMALCTDGDLNELPQATESRAMAEAVCGRLRKP